MSIFFLILPILISYILGWLITSLIMGDRKTPFFFDLPVSLGIGLALSSFICFFSLLLINYVNPIFVLTLHFLIIVSCLILHYRKHNHAFPAHVFFKDYKEAFCIFALLGLIYPFYIQIKIYPIGGWDAWSVWNFKAKFIFLAKENWQMIFDPLLWRSSPHYPLLLPLANVWEWIFQKNPVNEGPQVITLLYAFLTSLLLYSGIKRLTKSNYAILPALFIGTLPMGINYTTSQYCDIVVGFYLLSALIFLLLSIYEKNSRFTVLFGMLCGILSFTKTEGFLLSTLLILLFSFYHLYNKSFTKSLLQAFIPALVLCSFPFIIFKLWLAPDNLTFINGLISAEKPSDWLRLKQIGAFYLMEFIQKGWHGIWAIIGICLILSWKRCFSQALWILPVLFAGYFMILTAYFFINTEFEILWWLSVTVKRILIALLPSFLLWAYVSLWRET